MCFVVLARNYVIAQDVEVFSKVRVAKLAGPPQGAEPDLQTIRNVSAIMYVHTYIVQNSTAGGRYR